MILSTQTDYLGQHFGEKKAIEILANAGFDAIDLSLFGMKNDNSPFLAKDYKTYVQSLSKEAQSRGVHFNQAHAPFPSSKTDAAYNEMIFDRIVRAIEIAGMLGAKCIVVHPQHHLYFLDNEKALKDANMAFYRALAPYAKSAGVKIALENMWQHDKELKKTIVPSACARTKDMIDYFDTLADDCFTVCLDLGHCGLTGFDAATVIRGLGRERLGALHVHDNDYCSDAHLIPYAGRMHWNTICDALAEIGYAGDFTLEADCYYLQFPETLAPQIAGFMCNIGRELIGRIEKTKK